MPLDLAARMLAASAAILLVAAACGGREARESDAPTPTQSTTTTAAPADEHFGYIRGVSDAGPAATLAFDEADFLTGQEAQQAAEKDGAIEPGEAVPNDYYIRNADKATKTYPIANDARITAERCSLCRSGKPGELGPFLAAFRESGQTYDDAYRGKDSLYWLTIDDGRVVAIDEQYVP